MDISFEELKRFAEETNADFRELVRRTRCGTSCGMCKPYIRIMLETGLTEIPVLPQWRMKQFIQEHAQKKPVG